jgi:hypothetical protein
LANLRELLLHGVTHPFRESLIKWSHEASISSIVPNLGRE